MSRALKVPSPLSLSNFLTAILPLHPADFSWYYHTPISPEYFDITRYTKFASPVTHFVLGITPSERFYNTLDRLAQKCEKYYGWDRAHEQRVAKGVKGIVCFLHRPFDLDRRRLPRGVLVVASHKRFDELLTTGYNLPLSLQLGVSKHGDRIVCLQGYKGDADRRYGLVGCLETSQKLGGLEGRIRNAFHNSGDLYLPTGWTVHSLQKQDEGNPERIITRQTDMPTPDQDITVIANMNAFNDVTVDEVYSTCIAKGWVDKGSDASNVLYLTGQPRELGLVAAQRLNMPVMCVGHQGCEEWGIRYLAQRAKQEWTDLEVETILDVDEVGHTKQRPNSKPTPKPRSRAERPARPVDRMDDRSQFPPLGA